MLKEVTSGLDREFNNHIYDIASVGKSDCNLDFSTNSWYTAVGNYLYSRSYKLMERKEFLCQLKKYYYCIVMYVLWHFISKWNK